MGSDVWDKVPNKSVFFTPSLIQVGNGFGLGKENQINMDVSRTCAVLIMLKIMRTIAYHGRKCTVIACLEGFRHMLRYATSIWHIFLFIFLPSLRPSSQKHMNQILIFSTR